MHKLFLFFAFFCMSFAYGIDFMPVDQVKTGMKGYGITVAKNNKMVRFDVEIIDVLKNISPKRSVILAKFSGKDIDAAGIAQGMSGSPIYINEKLVGALAYTWDFLKEPIGGIQPIEGMLPVLEKKEKKPVEPFKFLTFEEKLAKDSGIDYFDYKSNQLQKVRAISTPLMLSGFSGPVYDFFKEKFEKIGFTVIQGSGGGVSAKEESGDLKPGDAVGIQLVRGDINMAAIGTVTYKEGNQVLIFGHPFLERGALSMPMTKAFVHYVMPSQKVSWKFASASKEVGLVYNDRETAVAGELGKKAEMVPVSLFLNNDGEKTNFNYEMAPDPLFFPNNFAGVIMNSVLSKDSKMSEGSVECEFKIKVLHPSGKTDELILKDFFIGTNADAIYQSLIKVIAPIQYLMYNWFEEIKISGIEVNIKKKQNYYVASLDKAYILNQEVRPGDTLKLRVFFKLYKGGIVDKTIDIQIPKTIESDAAFVWVSSAKLEFGNAVQQYGPKFAPKNFEQLLQLFKENSSFNDIAVWLDVPQNSAVVDGYFLPNLPISKLMNYAYRERGNAFLSGRRVIKYFPTNYLVAGYISVPVRIIRDDN